MDGRNKTPPVTSSANHQMRASLHVGCMVMSAHFPRHLGVRLCVAHSFEAEALIEPPRRCICSEDAQLQRYAAGGSLGLEFLDKASADSSALKVGQECDVLDMDAIRFIAELNVANAARPRVRSLASGAAPGSPFTARAGTGTLRRPW
jgi:hypothetical protein